MSEILRGKPFREGWTKMKSGTKKGKKIVARALALLLAAGLAWAAVTYFAPMLTGDEVATYQAYTVQKGDVKTNIA